MSTITSNISYATQTIAQVGRWGVKKIVESVQSDRIYYLLPTSIALYTGYHSLDHYKVALFGTDSWDYRVELYKEAREEEDLSFSERIQRISHAIFGSIEIEDRKKEFLYGTAYLAASLGTLYALHCLVVTSSQRLGQFDSHFDESTKEIFPEDHSRLVHEKALDHLGPYQDQFDQILLNPQVPQFSKDAEIAVHLADQALLPAATPFESTITRPLSSFINTLTFGYYGKPNSSFSSEYLSTQELHEVYQKTRQLIIDKAPFNWQAKVQAASKGVCNWTWGYLNGESEDCANFATYFEDAQTKLLEKRLETLDHLYETLMQRAILQSRGDCSATDDAAQICQNYYSKYVSSVDDPLSMLSTIASTMQRKGQEFVNQVQFAKIFPITQWERSVEKLELFTTVLRGITPENNLGILRRAAARFFGLAEDFGKKEFKDAFKAFSKAHHADKSKSALSEALFSVGNQLNEIFGRSAPEEYYQVDKILEGGFALPSPWSVLKDLSSWTFDWIKQNPPETQF